MLEGSFLTDPRVAQGYFLGQEYRVINEQRLAKLNTLIPLADVEVEAAGELIPPGSVFQTAIRVPKVGYYPNFVGADEQHLFTKYLLDQKSYSLKSKVAQSALSVIPRFSPNRSYIEGLIDDSHPDYVAYPALLFNWSPVNACQLPEQPFPALRFFIPNATLKGRDLVDLASEMNAPTIKLEDRNEKVYPLEYAANLPHNHPLLCDRSENPFVHLVLDIERQAKYRGEGIVDLGKVLGIPSRDRELLDIMWRLDWCEDFKSPNDASMIAVYISESVKVKMPDWAAVVIDMDNEMERGVLSHVESPLVEPGFGQHLEEGAPVRLERRFSTLGIDRRIIRLRGYYCSESNYLHKAN